mgnify:CR=1 FL=1
MVITTLPACRETALIRPDGRPQPAFREQLRRIPSWLNAWSVLFLYVQTGLVLWATVGLDSSYAFIVLATACSGIGLGIASPALTSLMANSVDEADLGVAGAMQQLMTQLGAVMGSAVLATVSVTATPTNLAPLHLAFVVGEVVATGGCVAATFVRSTPRT